MRRRDDFDPDRVRSAPARKDTRRWCRGKTKVPHQLAIRMGDKYTYARRECGWYQRGKPWGRWACVEQEYCTVCGKILRHSLGRDCSTRNLEDPGV